MKRNNGKGGKEFEVDFKNSFPDSIYVLRLQDSGSSFSGGSGSRFTPPSPYDFIVYNQYDKNCYCFELKSTKSTSIPFPLYDDCNKFVLYRDNKKEYKEEYVEYKKIVKSKSIKFHQIENLLDASKCECISYMVFNFRKENLTYCLDIENFIEFWKYTTKSSINIKDIKEHNGILIEQTKIRKTMHYSYDLSQLMSLE